MPTSFAISASANPEASSPESTCCLTLFSVVLLRPAEGLKMSVISAGSRPKARPTITASNAAIVPAAAM